MSKPIASVSRTREILDTYSLRARKSYGQNFFVDVSAVKQCAETCRGGGAVIEIGPGIGALSQQLAEVCAHVTAYEIDSDLIPVLKETLKEYSNVEIIHQDFLECDLAEKVRSLKQSYGSVSVCANLPYCITTPVLFKILECEEEIPSVTVMVQKEVADRFLAKEGSPDYGALSAEYAYSCTCQRIRSVPRTSFLPAPNVDSAVIQFIRRKEPLPPQEREKVFELIQACFKQRRKTIYNNLKEYLQDSEKTAAVLKNAGIAKETRAQQMSVEDFCRLYERIRESQ